MNRFMDILACVAMTLGIIIMLAMSSALAALMWKDVLGS